MYNLNLNVNMTAATGNLLVDSTGTTPRTPEILNSLIAMTNPLDSYQFGDDAPLKLSRSKLPMGGSSDSNSSNSSSQLGSPTSHRPSVQNMCSQLIKAGLKLTIQQKRKHCQSETSEDLLDLDSIKKRRSECSESEEDKIKQENSLTPEDEERRRRRRERNKIAATKCRLKKRERISNLIRESETLETQHVDLKAQLQELQNQQQMLTDVLNLHRPQCAHNIAPATKERLYKLPPVNSVMETHSYSRPVSVLNGCFRNQDIEIYNRPTPSPLSPTQHPYSRAPHLMSKPPSIIVEEIIDYDTHQLTDLDSPYSYDPCHTYSSQGFGSGMDSGCLA